MAYEPKPDKQVKLDRAASNNYGWLQGRPDREAILRHAHETGSTIPSGLHVDQFGGVKVDSSGVRHNWVLKMGNPEYDNATRNRYMSRGYSVVEDNEGIGYNLSISQAAFEANEKAGRQRYDMYKNAAKQRVKGGVSDKDWVEEMPFENTNLRPEDMLDD